MKSRLEWVRADTGKDIATVRKCELLEVARSTLYAPLKAKEKDTLRRLDAEEKEKRMEMIDKIHAAMPATGARKMARMLTKDGLATNRYEAGELMRQMNIYAIYPLPNTSKPAKGHPRFPYLLKGRRIWLPNQAWAIDITYLPYKGGHLYLTAIIDLFSRMIVGWALADSLEVGPVIACVQEAFGTWGVPALMNSDQGSHFTSKAYVELLAVNHVAQSMDGKARWVDNVWIERWFRTLKSEYVHINVFESPRELRAGCAGFIEKYNSMRLHESLGYETPATVWGRAFSEAA